MYHLRIPIQHLTSHTHHPCIPYTSSLHPRHNLSLPPCIPCIFCPCSPAARAHIIPIIPPIIPASQTHHPCILGTICPCSLVSQTHHPCIPSTFYPCSPAHTSPASPHILSSPPRIPHTSHHSQAGGPAACPGGQEGQRGPGLCQEQCGHQGGERPAVLGSGEAAPRVLGSFLGSPWGAASSCR